MSQRILISAGEVSGDRHAAGLIQELQRIKPGIEFFGLGGYEMKNLGVSILYRVDQLSFMGFWEILKHIKFIRKVKENLLKEVDRQPCKLAILVDYPGFNLRLAEELKKRGVTIIYYISPQVWAWGQKRIEKIKKLVDLMLVFFPFEEELYQKHAVNVRFVGHPLVQLAKPRLSQVEFFRTLSVKIDKRFIGLFPGSRPQEIQKHLPIMVQAGQLILNKYPDFEFLISLAPGIKLEEIKESIPDSFPVRILDNHTYDIMGHSEFLIVKSGTSTVEAALCGTPFVVIYKTSPLTYLIAKQLVQVPHVAMANILAEKRVIPEFIQNQTKPEKIAQTVTEILENRSQYDSIKAELAKVRQKLGSGNAYRQAAEAVVEYL